MSAFSRIQDAKSNARPWPSKWVAIYELLDIIDAQQTEINVLSKRVSDLEANYGNLQYNVQYDITTQLTALRSRLEDLERYKSSIMRLGELDARMDAE